MTPNQTNSEKQWLIYFLVLFFVGFLGVHKFYVKKNTAGAVQLCLFLYWIIMSFAAALFLQNSQDSVFAAIAPITGVLAFLYLGIWLLLDFINSLIHVGNNTWTQSLIPAGKR